MSGFLTILPDGKSRCRWCDATPAFIPYHDTEWGFPVKDDFRLFEKLCLEGFQSGLSWRTILAKREAFREVFVGFDFHQLARFTPKDVTRLLQDERIIRHRGKIEATLNNARQAVSMVKQEGSLAAFIWRYEPTGDSRRTPQSETVSKESIALSKELKKRGWKFVGPTTIFAFMQAMGLINDHAEGCIIRPQAERQRERFKRPTS
ncbi:MAG TPA: DNA-3-methyladenine glycosylase I [Opitutaceae bacterium]|nr:DNA-3-methyladenine glycosylase I [Opitutaceae bacterium]